MGVRVCVCVCVFVCVCLTLRAVALIMIVCKNQTVISVSLFTGAQGSQYLFFCH